MRPPERFPRDDPREWLNRAHSNLARAKLWAEGVYLEDLCFDAQQAGAVRLWNMLDHAEREAAAGWFVESVEGGRRQIDEAVAAARRFRPQTVRRWPLDRIARSMGTLPLHDPVLAQVILLHRVCVAGRPAVAFLLGRGSERNRRGRGQRRRSPATGVNPASLCVARQSG